MDKKEEFTLSTIPTALKNVTRTPLGGALVTGALTWGASRLAYPILANLGKGFVKRVWTGDEAMTDEELDEELHGENSRLKKWGPLALGGLTTAAFLASQYNPNDTVLDNVKSWFKNWPGMSKNNSFQIQMTKNSSEMFNWDINDQTYLDFGKLIPIRTAQSIILNDPNTEVYQKGNALDVINDAAKGRNTGTVSAGAVFDSALNNVQKNLTVAGVANATIKGIVGYGIAKAFTNTLGSMVDMPKDLRNAIVNTGMISGIVKGMIE